MEAACMLLFMSGTPRRGDRRKHIGIYERKVHFLHGNTFGGVLLFLSVFPVVLWNLFIVFYYNICKLQEEYRSGGVIMTARSCPDGSSSFKNVLHIFTFQGVHRLSLIIRADSAVLQDER